jgi:MoxR-like ATPase
LNPALTHIHDTLIQIKQEIQKEIIGQDSLIEKLIITFFAWGHALLEGVPGLGKTKTIRTFASVLGLTSGRVSFTPDLLPSDLTGNEIYRQQTGKFEIRKWPIFTSILLADEINRTPPKVQSALLEAMEEKKVTLWDKTLDLPSPFVVFATQNPLEHEGTYPLPEAQLDRFLMRIMLQYPSQMDEKRILIQETSGVLPSWGTKDLLQEARWADSSWRQNDRVKLELTPSDLLEMIDYIEKSVRVDEKIYDYVWSLLTATRKLTMQNPPSPLWQGGIKHLLPTSSDLPPLSYGASTRAGLALVRAARVRAVMMDRDYVLPEDIKSLAHDIIDHRIGLSYEAMGTGITTYGITEQILDSVQIP